MRVLLLYPTGNYLGNLYWPTPFQGSSEALKKGMNDLSEKGYWVSTFPEGDGLVFKHENLDREECLSSFEKAFPWMVIEVTDQSQLNYKLADINKGKLIKTIVLAPIEKLLIYDQIDLGNYKLIPAITGDYEEINNHPWGDLLYDPDAKNDISGFSSLMNYTLVELSVDLPYELLIKSKQSIKDQNILIKKVLQEADKILDFIRLEKCSFSKMEYQIGIAGQMSDGFSIALLMPENFEPQLLSGIVYPAMVQNNWLGLELDTLHLDSFSEKIISIIDGRENSEIDNLVLSSLKRFGQSFYIIQDEARFLSLVYAIDALTQVEYTGKKHREYVCTIASGADKKTFYDLVRNFDSHYKLRNKIVHEGKSFEDLGVNPVSATNTIAQILYLCINHMVNCGFKTKRDFINWVNSNRLQM